MINTRNVVATFPIAIILIVGLMGCGKADMARLERADSMLVREHADSAMLLLSTFTSNDLSDENKAYFALLYTKTQYKLYIPIHSDSLINTAVRYYTGNYDQHKLTDALMYRGAVYAELKWIRLAIESYKDAVLIADTTDLMTMGLLNFRMGELYQNSYIENGEPIKRYKDAAIYFNKVGHKAFEHYSYGYLGQMYSVKDYDSAIFYINKAIDWAIGQDDQKQLLNGCCIDLAKLYWYYNVHIDKRKELLLNVYQDLDIVDGDIIYHLSDAYCKLGLIDSAKYYLAQFPQSEQLLDIMNYNMMLESLSVAQNDYKTAYQSKIIASKVADEIVSQGKAEQYYAIDRQYDNTAANAKIERLSGQKITHRLIIIIVVLFLAIAVAGSLLYFKLKRKAMIVQEQTIDKLQTDIKNQQNSSQKEFDEHIELVQGLNYTIDQKRELEQTLRGVAEDRVKIIRQLLEIKYQYKDNPVSFFRRVDEVLLLNKKSRDDCQIIINMANQLYGNIIDHFNIQCSGLNFNDKLLIAFACMEFSAIETMAFMSMVSSEAVYSARRRLAVKLGVRNLHEYIKEIKRVLIQK